ncbi:hypothetical protein BH23PAT1_BH23PAT1_2120 [soil metagenome]
MTFKNWKLLDVRQPHSHIESFVYIYIDMSEFISVSKNQDYVDTIRDNI